MLVGRVLKTMKTLKIACLHVTLEAAGNVWIANCCALPGRRVSELCDLVAVFSVAVTHIQSYWLTNQPTPFEKPMVAQLVTILPPPPAFYESRTFITSFAKACHFSVFWATWMQSTPFPLLTLPKNFLFSFGFTMLSTYRGAETWAHRKVNRKYPKSLKYGAGETWRRSVWLIVWEMKKYYT